MKTTTIVLYKNENTEQARADESLLSVCRAEGVSTEGQNQNNMYGNVQHMTSLEIAELTGKPHNDVMKAIRKMEPAWKNIAGSNFRLGSYKDANGQLRPCYSLTKTECLYIATKYNDEARCDRGLMRDIRKMEPAWKKVCKSNFRLTSRTIVQPNGGTREVPCYVGKWS